VKAIRDRSIDTTTRPPTAAAVTQAIVGALRRDAASDAESIVVRCDGNDVWLSGHAQSWAACLHAEAAARAMPSVRRVHNNIRLQMPPLGSAQLASVERQRAGVSCDRDAD
jgi:osmotically-inducible protein OsmY